MQEPKDPKMSGRIATIALLVMFALVIVVVVIGG